MKFYWTLIGHEFQHGFAGNVPWEIASFESDDVTTTLVLHLEPSDYSRNMWNHEFLVTFEILVGDNKLMTELVVENIDAKTFSFTTALHLCLKTDVSKTTVMGLRGCKRLDKAYKDPANPAETSLDKGRFNLFAPGTSGGSAFDSSSKHGRLL